MDLPSFDKLIGSEVDFYGVDCLRFRINGVTYEAIEDPDDGYRSALREIRIADEQPGGIFFNRPVTKLTIIDSEDGSFSGYEFKSPGHVWLQIGTDYRDDYYPCFVFSYLPPAWAEDGGL